MADAKNILDGATVLTSWPYRGEAPPPHIRVDFLGFVIEPLPAQRLSDILARAAVFRR